MNDCEFVWTFPVYILAMNYTVDPATESIVFDDQIRFIAPEAWPNGPKAIALFTDSDLANEFREQSPMGSQLDLVAFGSPAGLKAFLVLAQHAYSIVVADLNRKSRKATPFMIQEVLAAMDRLIAQGNQDPK